MNMPNSPKTIAPTTPCKALVPHSARRCIPASSSGSSADSNDVPVLFNQKFNWKEHPDNAATIERGLPHYNYCTDMFASNVATGSMARSSMQPPVESDEEGQVDPLGQNSDSRTRSREWGEEESYTPLNSQGPNRFSTTSSRNEPHEYSTSSSRRKKTKNLTDKDAVLISSLQKWDAFLDAKTASLGPPVIEVVQKCVASLRAMEDLPESLFNKAIKELKSDTPTRAFFLELNQRERRSWVESLGHP
ncbi:hypothetical protein DH2020_021045 [Rehmannia glutinosa]|uniref:Uncharacterized protein n=1 Tax=Rehmannia glutinosa TaxID=99300 RepID=A0ABR0WDM3_REHGL